MLHSDLPLLGAGRASNLDRTPIGQVAPAEARAPNATDPGLFVPTAAGKRELGSEQTLYSHDSTYELT
jgi:hypothetical protein